MKWKKENNIKSLNDPTVKIDSNGSPLDHENSHRFSKSSMQHDSSFKSEDEDDEDE